MEQLLRFTKLQGKDRAEWKLEDTANDPQEQSTMDHGTALEVDGTTRRWRATAARLNASARHRFGSQLRLILQAWHRNEHYLDEAK
jgi:hypothetical protein